MLAMNLLGQALETARLDNTDYTLEAVADLLDTVPEYILGIEQGRFDVLPYEMLSKYCALVGASLEGLLYFNRMRIVA